MEENESQTRLIGWRIIMSNDLVANLFNVRSHNPSFFAIRDTAGFNGELLDFCIPVNLHFPPAEMVQLVHERLGEILRYYPDYAEAHQRYMSEMTGLAPETIVPVNGSTEIITRLCQQAEGPIVTSVPTFSRWTDLPEELNLPLHTLLRKRANAFRLEVEEIVERVREVRARTLVICNPNNPTGAWLTIDDVKHLALSLPDLDAVIIDESFIDFADLPGVVSAADCVNDIPNLIVVKSMGKSLGWHGIRLGYAVAESTRAQKLRALQPFWNINGLAAYVLKTATRFTHQYRESFSLVAEDRRYMTEQLATVPGLVVYPSQANFLFVELPVEVSGRRLRDRLLKDHGILVRECSNKIGATEQQLRLAVQTRAAVDSLVTALCDELKRLCKSTC
jgi:histidinol-phosphate/aromatic aminotransferase/cobyric acid decarboxylase-like protein